MWPQVRVLFGPGAHLTEPTMVFPSAGALLIVDDREDIRRSMQRYFSLYFEPVLLAATPHEAEVLLRTEQPRFLLCDFWLGADYLPATEYIPRWRRLAPSLRRVALMTGTNLAVLGDLTSVDTLFQKPLEPDRVVKFFLGDVTAEEPADSDSHHDSQ